MEGSSIIWFVAGILVGWVVKIPWMLKYYRDFKKMSDRIEILVNEMSKNQKISAN